MQSVPSQDKVDSQMSTASELTNIILSRYELKGRKYKSLNTTLGSVAFLTVKSTAVVWSSLKSSNNNYKLERSG